MNLNNGVSPSEVLKKNFRVRREDFLELVEMIRLYARESSKRARQDIITLEKKGRNDAALPHNLRINNNDCKCNWLLHVIYTYSCF